MLTEGHIFTIRTKDPTNVSAILATQSGIEILGINVLKDQIQVGDFIFIVLGGGKTATPWARGLIAIAHFSCGPYDEGYDPENAKNFKVKIDIDVLFPPPITRGDLVVYPLTFDIIGIGPITKWEPNQAITNVPKDKAIALLQAIWEMRPVARQDVENLFDDDLPQISGPVRRFAETVSPLGGLDLRPEFIKWAPHKKPTKTGKSASEDTIKKYVGYLNCLNKPMSNTGNASGSGWDGVVEFITGRRPEKSYYQVERPDEFDGIFGDLGKALEGEPAPDGVILANYNQVATWANAPSIKKHMCLLAAYAAYREFLEWREAEQKKKDEPKVATANMLTVALKMFDKERKASDKHNKYADFARTWFADYTPQKLKDDFATFQRDLIWSERVRMQVKADYAYVDKFADLLDDLKRDPRPLAYYLGDEFKAKMDECPGIGISTIVDMLMKMHPDEYCAYTGMMHSSLKMLGLLPADASTKLNSENYRRAMGLYEEIRQRMIQMGIYLTRGENTGDPDFLTVNSFLWFVDENKDLIKEKVMSKAMKKPTAKKITTGKAEISELLGSKEDSLMTMLIAGLLTKPLAILAGVSGTGKSRMVRHLAYKTCLDEDLKPNGESAPGNFKMVQVKPSWHDSADLLGYRSAVNEKHEYVSTDFVKFVLRAHAYPKTPFFVCLDEMNLAPVEHYFAEFLSACESIRKSDVTGEWTSDPIVAATDFDNNVLNLGGDVLFESADAALDAALKKTRARIEKEGLFIPRNLFVVGTVNMDDSTGGFSRKVLDRAMTVVMNEVNLEDLKKDDKDLTLSDDNLFTTVEIAKFINREDFDKGMLENGFIDQLEDIRLKLAKTPFALAYRFARETCMYKKALLSILDSKEVLKKSDGSAKMDGGAAIDADRACGDIALDHMILMKLLPRLTGTTEQRSDVLKDIKEYLGKLVKDKKVSAVTLDEMEERAKSNGGYLSFWP